VYDNVSLDRQFPWFPDTMVLKHQERITKCHISQEQNLKLCTAKTWKPAKSWLGFLPHMGPKCPFCNCPHRDSCPCI